MIEPVENKKADTCTQSDLPYPHPCHYSSPSQNKCQPIRQRSDVFDSLQFSSMSDVDAQQEHTKRSEGDYSFFPVEGDLDDLYPNLDLSLCSSSDNVSCYGHGGDDMTSSPSSPSRHHDGSPSSITTTASYYQNLHNDCSISKLDLSLVSKNEHSNNAYSRSDYLHNRNNVYHSPTSSCSNPIFTSDNSCTFTAAPNNNDEPVSVSANFAFGTASSQNNEPIAITPNNSPSSPARVLAFDDECSSQEIPDIGTQDGPPKEMRVEPSPEKSNDGTKDKSADRPKEKSSSSHQPPFYAEIWNQRYVELLDFVKENGHANVPHTYPKNQSLAGWVKRQRRLYKQVQNDASGQQTSALTADRITQLESVGFVWDSHVLNWREKFNALKEFRNKHGHCNVALAHKANKLGSWVKCQRRQYKLYCAGKPSAMFPERIQELEELGFEWEIRQRQPNSSKSNKTAARTTSRR